MDYPELKTQTQPKLLTVSEAAKLLRISNWLLYKLIRNEELRTLTIASRRLIAAEDLADYINNRKDKNEA